MTRVTPSGASCSFINTMGDILSIKSKLFCSTHSEASYSFSSRSIELNITSINLLENETGTHRSPRYVGLYLHTHSYPFIVVTAVANSIVVSHQDDSSQRLTSTTISSKSYQMVQRYCLPQHRKFLSKALFRQANSTQHILKLVRSMHTNSVFKHTTHDT